jgi:superfamily I DNA/RNA helicase
MSSRFGEAPLVTDGSWSFRARGHVSFARVAPASARGYPCVVKDGSDPTDLHRGDALRILRDRPDANLGWRAVLEVDELPFAVDAIREAVNRARPLVEIIPANYREAILAESGELVTQEKAAADAHQPNPGQPTIRLTSFEGSKGLSAQQVFIVGLHESEMPRDARHIDDIEICKVLVALTRTRKQCHLLHTWRWSVQPRRPSIFLGWIDQARLERVRVKAEYW